MKESIRDHARIGLVHFMAYPACLKGEGPILESLSAILADPYFDFVEISWIKDAEVRKKAVALLKQSKIGYAYAAQPPLLTQKLDLNAADPAARKAAVDQVKRCVDEAVEIEAQGIAFLSGKDPGPAGRAEARKLLMDSILEIARHLKSRREIPLVLETFDRVPFGKNALIGPNAEAVEVSVAVRKEYPKFGLMLDLSHLPLQNEDSREALTLAKDHLVHAHIGNCVKRVPTHPAYGDSHPRFGIPEGENDTPQAAAFLRALLEIGYLDPKNRRVLSFEVAPMAAFGESTDLVVANAKRTLEEAWRIV